MRPVTSCALPILSRSLFLCWLSRWLRAPRIVLLCCSLSFAIVTPMENQQPFRCNSCGSSYSVSLQHHQESSPNCAKPPSPVKEKFSCLEDELLNSKAEAFSVPRREQQNGRAGKICLRTRNCRLSKIWMILWWLTSLH